MPWVQNGIVISYYMQGVLTSNTFVYCDINALWAFFTFHILMCFSFFVPTGPYVYFGEKILKLFGRSYSRTSLSLNPVTLDPPRLCSHHHRLHKFIISLVNFLFLHIQSDLYLNCCTKYVSFLKLCIFFRPLIVLHEYRDIMKIPEIWLHLTNDNDKWHEYVGEKIGFTLK